MEARDAGRLVCTGIDAARWPWTRLLEGTAQTAGLLAGLQPGGPGDACRHRRVPRRRGARREPSRRRPLRGTRGAPPRRLLALSLRGTRPRRPRAAHVARDGRAGALSGDVRPDRPAARSTRLRDPRRDRASGPSCSIRGSTRAASWSSATRSHVTLACASASACSPGSTRRAPRRSCARRSRFTPSFARPLRWLLERLRVAGIVARDGEAYRLAAPPPEPDLDALRAQGLAHDPSYAPAYELLDVVAALYPRVARGEVQAERALFFRVGLWVAYFSNANGYYALSNRVAARAAVARLAPADGPRGGRGARQRDRSVPRRAARRGPAGRRLRVSRDRARAVLPAPGASAPSRRRGRTVRSRSATSTSTDPGNRRASRRGRARWCGA